MILANVNIGTGPSAGDGDPLRTAFTVINNNFQIVTNNVNALTNSVTSVAGRTGNVILTVNDIVGLNSTYATQANITAANIGMKGYVDSKITANIALLVNSAPSTLDTIRELADAIGDDPNFAVNIALSVSTANTKMRGYVDGQITAANAGVTAANLGMKGYVDSVASQSIYGNSNVASFLPTYSGNLNAKYATITGNDVGGLNALAVGVPGIEIFGNTIAQFHSNINSPVHLAVHNKNTGNLSTSGFMATADIGDENTDYGIMAIVGSNWAPPIGHFLKPLETVLVAAGGNLVLATTLFNGANANPKDIVFITSTGTQPETALETLRIHTEQGLLSANLQLGANVGILFNDGTRQISAYSNVQTAAFTNLSTYAYSANVTAANLGMKGYVDSVASQSIYGNANVASFLPTYSGNLSAQHLRITSDPINGLNGLTVGSPGIENFSNVVAQFHSNINSPVHLAVHNKNTGNASTSGFIATADIGDENNYLAIMAIVGSNWAPPGGHFLKPLDSVMVGAGGNLVLGTTAFNGVGADPKDLIFVVGTSVQPENTLEALRIHAENGLLSANLELGANVGILFNDGTRQISAYSNVQVEAFANLSNYAYNANVTAANLGMKGYVDSVASQSIYGNANVKSYLTEFDGNIVPSANVTYSLGNVTNRWKDLYLSGNTIFLGDSTISTEGGRLVTTGVAISPPTGAVGLANVQFEAATNFDQIRSYYVDNNFGYTPNLKSWSSAPIVWDELRSAKIKINSSIVAGSTPDFASLDTSGGRFANAVATLDATGNIASLTITDGGVGYDAYYPYYSTDSTGYDLNYIGQSYTGSPTGKSFRRIGLIPTTGADIGNITSIGSFTRYSDLPTVGTNSYTWTGNTGTTISFTVDWASNTVTAYTYTPALPALTSAQEWQDWILDYQSTNDYGWIIGSGSITGGGGTPIQAVYDYLSREALPTSLTYDQSATTWYPGNLLVNNSATIATLSSSTFFITFNRTSINYATLENDYGNPVYWSRGLSADTGISSGGDMTVAGDLRVAGDLYVSPTSIYMGDLRISAADGNLKVNTGIKFSDDSVQSTAYSNVQVAAYLTANPPASSYSNVQVATYLPTYTGNVAAGNVKVSSAYRFETGNVNITNESSHLSLNPDTTANALAGVKIGGSGYLLGPNSARNLTLNYGGISGALGIQANVTIGSGGSGNLFVVGNVIARDITGGNILATGTSGVLGFNGGGFAQQATSNATQITSHFTSGNIQLMSIDLGASAVHTVTFACNKLTTNDLLLVKHISGGLTSVYVDAYVASDGLAVIWLRDITGVGTGAFTPMLKYAIVRAPSA